MTEHERQSLDAEAQLPTGGEAATIGLIGLVVLVGVVWLAAGSLLW